MKAYQFPTYEIPAILNNQRFLEAWLQWIEHLKEKQTKPTSLALKLQLKKLSKMELWRAVQCIEYSIEHNYQGLWEPKESNGNGCVFNRQITKTVSFNSNPKQPPTASEGAYKELVRAFKAPDWQNRRQSILGLFNQLNRVEVASLPFDERKIIMEWIK